MVRKIKRKAKKAIKKVHTKVVGAVKKAACKHVLGNPSYDKKILATVSVCDKCGTIFITPDDGARKRRQKQKKKH